MVKLRIGARSAIFLPEEPIWIPYLFRKFRVNTDVFKHQNRFNKSLAKLIIDGKKRAKFPNLHSHRVTPSQEYPLCRSSSTITIKL
jgi:hypothetical protein